MFLFSKIQVGGEFTFHVMKSMNNSGRIAVCGAISVYNNEAKGPPLGIVLSEVFINWINLLFGCTNYRYINSTDGLFLPNLQKPKNGRIYGNEMARAMV